MEDAAQFLEIMTRYGGKPGKPGAKYRAWLATHKFSPAAYDVISAHNLKKDSGVSAIDFFSEKGVMGTNDEEMIPIAIRDGLLIVGSCPNGDPVAIDVRDHLGAAGYIGHETMWQATSVRDVFIVLAPSLGQLALGLLEDRMPLDYYEAKSKAKV